MISIRNLTKRFGENTVWENINLDIHKGETVDHAAFDRLAVILPTASTSEAKLCEWPQ